MSEKEDKFPKPPPDTPGDDPFEREQAWRGERSSKLRPRKAPENDSSDKPTEQKSRRELLDEYRRRKTGRPDE